MIQDAIDQLLSVSEEYKSIKDDEVMFGSSTSTFDSIDLRVSSERKGDKYESPDKKQKEDTASNIAQVEQTQFSEQSTDSFESTALKNETIESAALNTANSFNDETMQELSDTFFNELESLDEDYAEYNASTQTIFM